MWTFYALLQYNIKKSAGKPTLFFKSIVYNILI
mgnify:FL=1